MTADEVLSLTRGELARAQGKFGAFGNNHEGYAVILEEVDELWHEVKHGTESRAIEEAIQVAAMAVRFVVDATDRATARHRKLETP